jgi:hypothetical protein
MVIVVESSGYGVGEKQPWCWRVRVMVLESESNGYLPPHPLAREVPPKVLLDQRGGVVRVCLRQACVCVCVCMCT